MAIRRQYLACLIVLAAIGGSAWEQSGSPSAAGSPAAAPALPTTAPASTGAGTRADAERVDMLIKQLGADRWSARDDATRRLISIGRPALPALRGALTDKDLEVVFRARFIVGEILGLTADGMAPLRSEVSAAFGRADYREMADKAKLLIELTDTAPMLDWLWLGHASQLAGDWPQAVKAYRKVVSQIDADLASGIKEVIAPEEPGEFERSGPRRPAGPIPYTPQERKDLVNKRTLLVMWIAKFQRFELKDPNAAAKTMLDAVANLEASKTEADYIWQKALKETPEAQLQAGDLKGAILSLQKLQQTLAAQKHKFVDDQRADVEAIAERIAAWPGDKPLPDIPWIFVLTEDKPSATLMLDEEATRRQSYFPSANPDTPHWRYAFAPPPGKEFDTIEFACDIEQIKLRGGGHFSCFVLTGGGQPGAVNIGDISWPDEQTGRKTVSGTFKIPPGVKAVHIATGTWKDYFNIRRVGAKATFRPATKNPPALQPRAWMQTELWPKGGKLSWGARQLHDERAYSGIEPGRDKLRYAVPGRQDVFEADFEIRPGKRYGIFVNLDSPFKWTQTNLELEGNAIPAPRLSISRLKDGAYLAVWRSRSGRIMIARSSDLVSWTRREPAPFNSVFDNIEPATFADADGTIWLAFFSNRLCLQESSSAGYGLWITSTRDAMTWSPIRQVSVGQLGGWPLGRACMLRGPDGSAWMFWHHLAADAGSFGSIRELKPINLKDVAGDSVYARNANVTVDVDKAFHMVFDGNIDGIFHATSKDGLNWEKPTLIVQQQRNQSTDDPQMIHEKSAPLLLYSSGSGSYIVPVDLSGKPVPADSGLKITNHVIPICGSRMGMPDDAHVFIIAGQDTTWLLRADIKDLAACMSPGPGPDERKADPPSPASTSASQPATRPLAWRDEESETLRALSSEELVRRIGTARLHASAEPPDKFSDKGAFIDGRTPDAASPKSAIVGHFYENLRPGLTLIIRTRPNGQSRDAYWAQMEARGQAFYSPPPPLKGQPTTQPATQPATQSAADAAEIERLIRQLGGDTSAQREAAQQALVKIGPPAMEALRGAAADISAERAERAKAALRQIEEATAQEQIRRTNERFSAMLRQWAKAGRTDDAPPALRAGEIQRLIEQLANPKVAERNSAQQALVKIGLPALEALTAATKDANPERAGRAKDALAQMALRKEDWPVSWRGMACSYRQLSPDPAKSMALSVDANRQAMLITWRQAGKDFVRSESTLSHEDMDSLLRALGRLKPWELNAGLTWPPTAGSGTLELTVTIAGRVARIEAPWPAGAIPGTPGIEQQVSGLMDVRAAVTHLSNVIQRDAAILAEAAKAGAVQRTPGAAAADAASARAAELIAEARRLGRPIPTGELLGDGRGAAIKASGAADLARAKYEETYDSSGMRSPANKANPSTLAAKEAFANVERVFLDAIEKTGPTDEGVYMRRRLAGAYLWRGQKERAAAMNKEADELKPVVEKLKEQHRLRREGADWPELAAFIRLLRQPGSDKITPEELAEAWGKLGARSDEAVGRLMEEFWPGDDYTYRWRTTKALGVLNSPASRKALLELALGSRKNDRPWICGAAQQYVEILTDKSEARRLLVSNDTGVLQNAAVGLRGVAIDKEMLTRLVELAKSPDRHLRFLVVCDLGDDPGGQFASEKVSAIVQAIPDISTMDKADGVYWPGSWTNAEAHYRAYIAALAKMMNAAKPIADEIARSQAGAPTWRCLVLARAFGGDAKSRPEARKILSDSEAGLFRAWAAEALGKIGTADDLPLLRDVAEKDPMQREQGGCIAPLNKQLYYPVRQSAQQAIKTLQAGPGTPGTTRPAPNGASPDGAGPQPAVREASPQAGGR